MNESPHSESKNHTKLVTAAYFLEEKIDLKLIASYLYRHIKFILSACGVGIFLAFIYSFSLSPQYSSTAMIGINGSESNNPYIKMGFMNRALPSNAAALLSLIRTRYILEPIIQQNALNISVIPHYFPVFGHWYARHHHGSAIMKPLLPWWQHYSWGGEELKIKSCMIPSSYKEQRFKLISEKAGFYSLYTAEHQFILRGKVGSVASSKIFPGISIELSQLKTKAGTEFFIHAHSSLNMALSLASQLSVTTLPGILANDRSGVYQLQLNGADPNKIVKILNAIVNYTILQDEQHKSLETAKTLKFLYQKLPDLKNKLDLAENALNDYRVSIGGVSIVTTGQMLVTEQTNLQQGLEKLRAREIELLEIYTAKHPLVIALQHQKKEIQNQLQDTENKINQFPAMHQREASLKTDAEIKNTMYLAMLKNIHELEVSQAGTVSDIKALSYATPALLLPSKKPYYLFMGLILGFLFSASIVLFRNMFNKKADNPEQLEHELQIPVQAIVPYTQVQKQLDKRIQSNWGEPAILAQHAPHDIAVEGLRSLQISLQILSSLTKDKIIVILGPATGTGKSFIALNLAQVIAASGKKTLLIDADIRKGTLHQRLAKEKGPGLSEYLEQKASFTEVLTTVHDNLFFISGGTYTQHPAEVLQQPLLKTLIDDNKNHFDQIIIDTPPLLPISDAILIARYADIKLFVINSSKDSYSDVKTAVKKIKTHGITINGLVLNYSQPRSPAEKYGYYTYGYGHNKNLANIS